MVENIKFHVEEERYLNVNWIERSLDLKKFKSNDSEDKVTIVNDLQISIPSNN